MSEKEFLKEIALQEPRKVFVNVIIIPYMNQIGFCFATGSPSDSVRIMRGLLNQLEDQDREVLKDVVKTLEGYEYKAPSNRLELEHLYQKISSHLHTYYLKEFQIRSMNPTGEP